MARELIIQNRNSGNVVGRIPEGSDFFKSEIMGLVRCTLMTEGEVMAKLNAGEEIGTAGYIRKLVEV